MKALEQLSARNWVMDRSSSARKRGKGYRERWLYKSSGTQRRSVSSSYSPLLIICIRWHQINLLNKRLNARENFSTEDVIKPWKSLLQNIVEARRLLSFKKHLQIQGRNTFGIPKTEERASKLGSTWSVVHHKVSERREYTRQGSCTFTPSLGI